MPPRRIIAHGTLKTLARANPSILQTGSDRPAISIILRYSSLSSKRWQSRQGKDKFAREARVQGLKSRAAFKLLEVGKSLLLMKQI
jgi:21S rRNA (uridine2791-2'-O)-methyltransferase